MFAAPVCSTWVWMSRSVTRRSRGQPLGNEQVPCVQEGNLQVTRVVLVLLYASFLGATWVVEQPMTSLLFHHPRFQYLASRTPWFKKLVWMGGWGATSPKPTYLASNTCWLSGLRGGTRPGTARLGPPTVTRYVDKHGKRRCTGTKALKATQCGSQLFFAVCLYMYDSHQLVLTLATLSHAGRTHGCLAKLLLTWWKRSCDPQLTRGLQ